MWWEMRSKSSDMTGQVWGCKEREGGVNINVKVSYKSDNVDTESIRAAALMFMFVCMCVCVYVCDGDSLCQGIFHSHCCIQKQMQYWQSSQQSVRKTKPSKHFSCCPSLFHTHPLFQYRSSFKYNFLAYIDSSCLFQCLTSSLWACFSSHSYILTYPKAVMATSICPPRLVRTQIQQHFQLEQICLWVDLCHPE